MNPVTQLVGGERGHCPATARVVKIKYFFLPRVLSTKPLLVGSELNKMLPVNSVADQYSDRIPTAFPLTIQ